MANPVQTVPPQDVVTTTYPGFPVVMTSTQEPHPASANKKIFLGLGVTEMIVGILSIILGGAALSPSINGLYAYAASGLWGGGWYVVAGALGIASGVKTNSCNIIAGLIVTIFASLAAFGAIISESIAAAFGPLLTCGYFYYQSSCNNNAFQAIHAVLACLSGIAFITVIIHSAYCCSGSCCRRNTQGVTIGNTMAVTTATTYPGGVMTTQIPAQNYGQPQPQYYGQPGSPMGAGYSNYEMGQQQSQQPPAYAPSPANPDFQKQPM